ncbi:MAG: UDP-N-acetylmuramate dehydrogenase [Deltaproteobacteria bacterium]
MRSRKNSKNRVSRGESLRTLTTFRIGGPARCLVRPCSTEELCGLLKASAGKKIRVLGAGSNILASDRGVGGVIVKLDAPSFRGLEAEGTRVRAGAGVPLASLLQFCLKNGLTGAEFLAGIPGTVGGGLIMNCGVRAPSGTKAIGDIVERVTVMGYNGRLRSFRRKEAGFGYRHSALSRYIVTGCVFALRKAPGEEVRRRLGDWMARRKGQEYGYPSAGCVFKNPAQASAGQLIDSCGLKGRRKGGALVSKRHANFIVNTGGASSSDVLALIRLVRGTVLRKRGIRLEPEIQIWK